MLTGTFPTCIITFLFQWNFRTSDFGLALNLLSAYSGPQAHNIHIALATTQNYFGKYQTITKQRQIFAI